MREFDEQVAWWARTIRRLVLEAVRRGFVPRRLVPAWLLFRLGIPSAAELRLLCAAFDELGQAAKRAGLAFDRMAAGVGLLGDLEAGA